MKESVLVRGRTLAEHGVDKMFTLCTKQYLSKGKDGYNVFGKCKIIIDEEEMPPLGKCKAKERASRNGAL